MQDVTVSFKIVFVKKRTINLSDNLEDDFWWHIQIKSTRVDQGTMEKEELLLVSNGASFFSAEHDLDIKWSRAYAVNIKTKNPTQVAQLQKIRRSSSGLRIFQRILSKPRPNGTSGYSDLAPTHRMLNLLQKY